MLISPLAPYITALLLEIEPAAEPWSLLRSVELADNPDSLSISAFSTWVFANTFKSVAEAAIETPPICNLVALTSPAEPYTTALLFVTVPGDAVAM